MGASVSPRARRVNGSWPINAAARRLADTASCPKIAKPFAICIYSVEMFQDQIAFYRALSARDSRFDGKFYVAVTSTGIYCRPVCKVRIPKIENCRFFTLAAQAEQQHFRPCLRCRPELAPGHLALTVRNDLALAAKQMIDSGRFDKLDAIAAKLGVTDRHLRRIFQLEFGLTLIAYEQSQRLLLAKRLLTDTSLPMAQVAQASGFASQRRFNDLFVQRYRLTPSRLRKNVKQDLIGDHAAIRLVLKYRPPLDWTWFLSFLKDRLIEGVEQIEGRTYRRQLPQGWISVTDAPDDHALIAFLPLHCSAHLRDLIPLIRRAFDLDCSPDVVNASLGDLAQGVPGIRLPAGFNGFEIAVRAILGQQISVKAATTIAGRFARQFGAAATSPFAGLDVQFPNPSDIADQPIEALAKLGIIRQRATAIVSLAQAIKAGRIDLNPCVTPISIAQGTLQALLDIPGVGPWTAHYIAMRSLRQTDTFLSTDLVVLKALGVTRPCEALALTSGWSPWRSYGVIHLWNTMKNQPTKLA